MKFACNSGQNKKNKISMFGLQKLASVAQLDVRLTGDQEVMGSTPTSQQHSFEEIDHEILSSVILSLPWFKKGCCQFLAKECTGYLLRGLILPSKSVVK